MNYLPEKLIKKYENSNLLRPLINLIPEFSVPGSGPFFSAIELSLLNTLNKMQENKVNELFEELSNGDLELTNEIIESEDFLNKYMITVKATLNASRKEKIKLFARLFKSSLINEKDISMDEYEEYLSILNELSYREFYILSKLHRYEKLYPKYGNENDLQRCTKFWEEFIDDIKRDLKIEKEEAQAMLTRISRTGCYEPITGAYLSYAGGNGKLTPIFYRIIELIGEK